MTKLINEVHPETREILINLRADYNAGKITTEQYNDVVRSCFRAEAERMILGKYVNPVPQREQEERK